MRSVRLGRGGPEVSELGLGCMGMAGGYGPADDGESVATVHAALDAGVTFFDAGDFYGSGHVELVLRDALKGGRRDKAFIAIKFGAQRSPDGRFMGDDGHPHSVKNFLSYTLKRLGTDYVDLYQPARLDPDTPIEDTVGAIADMVKAGYVRHIGLSEVGAKTIRRAAKVHPIAALQIEYSLLSRSIEAEILPTIRELGIDIIGHRNIRENFLRIKQPGEPNITFADQSAVYLGGVEVQLFWLGRAHTNGDTVIYFPDLKTVHTGDLIIHSSDEEGDVVTTDGNKVGNALF